MSVTIYEIAKRVGVSSSTVARVLRGDVREAHRRSAETARRVRAVALQLGYRPNLRARAFSNGRTKGVGLLYDEETTLFSGVNSAICNGLVSSLQRQGHHVVLVPIQHSDRWTEAILGGQIDGAIVFHSLPEFLRGTDSPRPLPFVMLGDSSEASMSRVFVDDFAGAYIATKHLISLHHREVMFFVHDSAKSQFNIQERLRGYRAAMNEVSLATHECVCVSEVEVLRQLVCSEGRVTAIICCSVIESTLLAHGLWQCGRSIPADISVVGFDDVFTTQYMTPPLTSIGFDALQMGEEGARLILREINAWPEKVEPVSVMLKPKLTVRGSTLARSETH